MKTKVGISSPLFLSTRQKVQRIAALLPRRLQVFAQISSILRRVATVLFAFYNLQISSESEWEVGAGGEAWGGCPRGEKVKNFKFLSWEGFLILGVWIGGWRQRRAGEGWPKEGKNISSSGSPSLIRSMPSSSPPPHKNQLIMMGPGTPWTSCSMSSSYWKGRWRLEDNPWSQSSVNRWLMAFEGIWCFVWQFGNA